MKIGFTGTQVGMSERQKKQLRLELTTATEFHHGDCIGADAEADEIARSMGIPIIIHPPSDPKKRARCRQPGDKVHRTLPYLDRNKMIVASTERLIAAPKAMEEELRSGTWSTVRYARKINHPVKLLRR
jgi:hypothetical protein